MLFGGKSASQPLGQDDARTASMSRSAHRRADDPGARRLFRTVLLWSDARLDVSLLALVWQCGQRTPIHDHHAACVVGLYLGAERETRYERTAPGAGTVVPVGEKTLRMGMVTVVPPGEQDIHRVEAIAPSPMVTVSLHFYEVDVTGRPGGSSIHQRFQEVSSGDFERNTRSAPAWHGR